MRVDVFSFVYAPEPSVYCLATPLTKIVRIKRNSVMNKPDNLFSRSEIRSGLTSLKSGHFTQIQYDSLLNKTVSASQQPGSTTLTLGLISP